MTITELPYPLADWRDCPPGCVTSMDLIHRSGITYRQLDYWTRTDLLRPLTRHPHATSGTNRYLNGLTPDAGEAVES